MSLKDKRVLVIGGGSGIGRAVAEGAIREGAMVVIASTNAEKIARMPPKQMGTVRICRDAECNRRERR